MQLNLLKSKRLIKNVCCKLQKSEQLINCRAKCNRNYVSQSWAYALLAYPFSITLARPACYGAGIRTWGRRRGGGWPAVRVRLWPGWDGIEGAQAKVWQSVKWILNLISIPGSSLVSKALGGVWGEILPFLILKTKYQTYFQKSIVARRLPLSLH